jgi:hypothetical protein
MSSEFRFLVLALATLSTAQNIEEPQRTITKASISASLITPAPIVHGDVFKRAIATCGYIRGNSGTRAVIFSDK